MTALTTPERLAEQMNADGLLAWEAAAVFRLEEYGDITEPSASEAVWRLCTILSYTTRDPVAIDARMRASALVDGHAEIILKDGRTIKRTAQEVKWERLGARTITRALAETEREYKRRQYARELAAEATAVDDAPLDVTVAELARNPALLQIPAAISPWLSWRGTLTVLVGREKLAGKSTLMASDATAAARAGHTVLWVDAEQGHHRVVKRFVDLGAPLDRLVTLTRRPRTWADVEAIIARVRPAAIYVDSLASFLMAVDGRVPDSSEGEAWQAKVGRFKTWTMLGAPDAGVTVALHATKADGNYRGSTGIGAAPDAIVTMRADPADAARRWLDCIGRWGFPAQCVRFGGEAKGYTSVDGAAAPTATGPKLSATRSAILAALKPGATWSEWRKAAGGSEATFNSAVRWLREQGLTVLDDATGTYRRNEFEIGQAA